MSTDCRPIFVSCGFLLCLLQPLSAQNKKGFGEQIPASFHPYAKVIDCSRGSEGTEDNPIPDCYVSLGVDYEQNTHIIAAKVADLNHVRIAKGDEDVSESVILKDYPWIIQECRNWCGPAALQGVLQYFGTKTAQSRIAKDIDAGECDKTPRPANSSSIKNLSPSGTNSTPSLGEQKRQEYRYRGTCLTDILAHLSKTIRHQLYGADHIGDRLGNFNKIAGMVVERVQRAIKEYSRPIIALINQTPPNPDRHFPGWEHSRPNFRRAHYITLIGYGGNYTGADGTGFFYFRDSSGHNQAPKDTVDINTVVTDLIANNGRGSCSDQGWNFIW